MIAQLIRNASYLKSESGENPEYDRALVELVRDTAGLTRDEAAAAIGVVGYIPNGEGE